VPKLKESSVEGRGAKMTEALGERMACWARPRKQMCVTSDCLYDGRMAREGASAWLRALALLSLLSASCHREREAFDLEGHAVDPFRSASPKGTVIFFVSTSCPISNRYAPEIRRMRARYA